MPETEIPVHHFPQVQGLHQSTLSADPWGLFFSFCLEEYQALMNRRAAREQSQFAETAEPIAQEQKCA